MSTWRELVYIVLDEIKSISDDSYFSEEHIIYMLDKYRALTLKQRYSDIKKQIPEGNYQTLCLDLIETPAIEGEPCTGGYYLKSDYPVSNVSLIGIPRVYPFDYFQGEISFINRDRMKYVGYNKFLQNIIYATIGPDKHLYLKSSNPQFISLEKVRMTAVFSSAVEAFKQACSEEEDILDSTFPLEGALVPVVTEFIVKELVGHLFRPTDYKNDGSDNVSNLELSAKQPIAQPVVQ